MVTEDLQARINGVLPDVNAAANTSLSVFYKGFHLLVDAGNGVNEGIRNAGKQLPDAILISSARKQHTNDLPTLTKDKVYCTAESCQRISNDFPSLAGSLVEIHPGKPLDVGPFSVVPVAADNAGDQPGMPGSVIFVIKAGSRKIVAGWDFIKLPNADNSILWNPDLLVLGTETYNEHPSTGMISISEAYNLVRVWNAKLCYVLHYSGEKDREDAKNQWHRGPEGPLSAEELQKAIDGHLLVSGGDGKYVIRVAKEGMIWTPVEIANEDEVVGSRIEVDALDQHMFAIEKKNDGKLELIIEDSFNRLASEFVNPRLEENSLHGDPIKGMMMKGPQLEFVVSGNNVRIDITKGKKALFTGNMLISDKDSKRIIRYLRENFR